MLNLEDAILYYLKDFYQDFLKQPFQAQYTFYEKIKMY